MSDEKPEHYKVLARKYRPQNFDEVKGQDALVRTLKNAITSGRIAHAYMLTGIRGTGKTTTARIIAKALNYTGPDGNAGPTIGSTDDCEICQAITEDRHPDIMEMDAASRTGVDDIREILDGVQYAPVSARYKVYIIDEVHMLSKQAFNALLKTLEEPPPQVIFIFATTEIRKVPVTILSRCQRFDLRRVDVPTLAAYYGEICENEGVKIDEEALTLIAGAADGSVRDGLSLLDQAISLGDGEIGAQQIYDMLGLSDRNRIIDLMEAALTGKTAESLDIVKDMHMNGADPVILMQDLLGLTHAMTKMKAVPNLTDEGITMGKDSYERAKKLAGKLSTPTLGRAWQIFLKGLDEMDYAPNPQAACEMTLLRLIYAADLPDPADLVKRIENGEYSGAGSSAAVNAPAGNGGAATTPTVQKQQNPAATSSDAMAPSASSSSSSVGSVGTSVPAYGGSQNIAATAVASDATPEARNDQIGHIKTLEDIDRALRIMGEHIIAGEVFQYVHLVKLEEGRIEIRMEPEARQSLPADMGKILQKGTDTRWMVTVSNAPGGKTLAEMRAEQEKQLMDDIHNHSVVKNVLEFFPDTNVKINKIKK